MDLEVITIACALNSPHRQAPRSQNRYAEELEHGVTMEKDAFKMPNLSIIVRKTSTHSKEVKTYLVLDKPGSFSDESCPKGIQKIVHCLQE